MNHRSLMVLAMFLLGPVTAEAGSLRVSPILLEIQSPAKTSILTLRNDDEQPLNAQIRVMRWTQVNGVDKLEPTTDVVASPPFATLRTGTDHTIRIVRVTQRPLAAEESYRLLIDEVPRPNTANDKTVAFVLRYSIPVFFTQSGNSAPYIIWSAQSNAKTMTLKAANSGSKRLRIANLKIRNPDGTLLLQRDGLIGYVLPGAAMQWQMPVEGFALAARGNIKLEAESEMRPLHATIAVQPGR